MFLSYKWIELITILPAFSKQTIIWFFPLKLTMRVLKLFIRIRFSKCSCCCFPSDHRLRNFILKSDIIEHFKFLRIRFLRLNRLLRACDITRFYESCTCSSKRFHLIYYSRFFDFLIILIFFFTTRCILMSIIRLSFNLISPTFFAWSIIETTTIAIRLIAILTRVITSVEII